MHVHRRLRLLAFPTRAGRTYVRPVRHETSQSLPRRRPGLRQVPFVRDEVFDHDRATAPRITVPHMLPSAGWTASASVALSLSRLNRSPRTIAVYASWPPSPTERHATLATRRALPLTWAGLPPAGTRQLPGAPSHDFAAGNRQSRGWPAEACPRAGLRPDPWAGHDTGGGVVTDRSACFLRQRPEISAPYADLWVRWWPHRHAVALHRT